VTGQIEHLAFKVGDDPSILTVRRAGQPRRVRPNRTFVEPARAIPVFAETDVLVVGGGPAGCAAAVAAARFSCSVASTTRRLTGRHGMFQSARERPAAPALPASRTAQCAGKAVSAVLTNHYPGGGQHLPERGFFPPVAWP
jgi:hypothetical protein